MAREDFPEGTPFKLRPEVWLGITQRRAGSNQGEIDTGKDSSSDRLLRPFVESVCTAELTLWGMGFFQTAGASEFPTGRWT